MTGHQSTGGPKAKLFLPSVPRSQLYQPQSSVQSTPMDTDTAIPLHLNLYILYGHQRRYNKEILNLILNNSNTQHLGIEFYSLLKHHKLSTVVVTLAERNMYTNLLHEWRDPCGYTWIRMPCIGIAHTRVHVE